MAKFRRWLIFFLCLTGAILCPHASHTLIAAPAKLKIGLVLDKGGRNDRSFNEGALKGALQAKKEWPDILVKDVVSMDEVSFESLLTKFARRDFDLIIGVGFVQKDAVDKVAKRFPKLHFVLIDAIADNPNVRSLMFAEHEGSFLAGALAAMASQKKMIGFIGGMDIPLIRRFNMGYTAGAQYKDKNIKVLNNYVGMTGTAWNNPPRAKELTIAQMDKGADIFFVAAGASGTGVFDAVEEAAHRGKKVYAIGVDSNQNWIKPGLILTSMLKRVDTAVYDTIRQLRDGVFTPGVQTYGLHNNGVDLAFDSYNKDLVKPEWLAEVNRIKKDIIEGKIKVPDYYAESKKP